MVTPKERALKAICNGKPDRVPVGIFLGGSWPIINSGLTLEGLIGDPEKAAQTFYQVNQKLDADIIMVGTGATALLIRALGGRIRFNARGSPDILSEAIRSEEDLLPTNVSLAISDPAMEWIRLTARELSKLAGNERLVLASGRAPFTLAAQMFGLDNFLRSLYKNRIFAHRLLEFTTEISMAYFKTMIEEGLVHGAFIADPIASGDLISKKHFEEFAFPYLKGVIAEVKDAGKPTMLHICGDIKDRLHLIPDTGVDSLSVDTKVSIALAKSTIGDRVSIAGNVDPVNVLQFGSEDDVRQAALCSIGQGADNGGFILLPGCDLAAGVPEANIRALVDSARSFAAYITDDRQSEAWLPLCR